MSLQRHLCALLLPGLIALVILLPDMAEAASGLRITQAQWSRVTGMLTVRGISAADGPVSLYDPSGRLLGTANPEANHRFKLKVADQWPELLCRVRAKADGGQASKAVSGRPGKDCGKVPQCQIIDPPGGLAVKANEDVSFKATAQLKDKKAGPLRLEWDFAGGSMGELLPGSNPPAYLRPHRETATVQFVRDNSHYRVRFTAFDGQRRYCEDAIDVKVGTPPETPPGVPLMAAKAAAESPARGSAKAAGVVVLPFAEMTMSGAGDYRYIPNVEVPLASGAFSQLNAVAYRKERLPVPLDGTQVAMKYAAASNPSDPVGPNSINSTSQNWPLNPDSRRAAKLLTAAIQKTDAWEVFVRPPADVLDAEYYSTNWMTINPGDTHGDPATARLVGPDEGYVLKAFPGDQSAATGLIGRYMPGRDGPFATNVAQEFTSYWQGEQKHIARAIPLTDIDDAGRVNPYPLLRVNAVDKATGETLASTDAVVGAGKDVHCRECHAKGKIAANDQFDWASIQQAFHSSKLYGNRGSCYWAAPFCTRSFFAPSFYESVDGDNRPSTNLLDQELAANKNIGQLHDFYDDTGEEAKHHGWPLAASGAFTADAPARCNGCHRSHINGQFEDVFDFPGWHSAGQPTDSNTFLSRVVHNFHEQLQLDPSNSGKILRDTVTGRPKLWDPATGANPNTLFPVMDASGNSLPSEMNCLRCHSGHREPLFRDRHYAAGLSCVDCHGDMDAVGGAHTKPKPGPEGKANRLDWYDQPNCGSCHTGNGNEGREAGNGFFSAGVMRQAFDSADPSASTRKPASSRFAVQESNPIEIRTVNVELLERLTAEGKVPADRSRAFSTLKLTPQLYRQSHDTHGNVACAACHGDAHEVWPNRDPKANDNLTANQLQGFAGPITECTVCHSKDAFAEYQNLDAGRFSGLPENSGVLGGPHGMHPMRDESWWKQAKDEIVKSGWHDNVYRNPGASDEDQCAACHGADHKGTRLSKTPVDLDLDLGNGKVARWKAGEEVGCNKCHSIEKSFRNGPTGFKPEAVNHDPVITSMPAVTEVVMGESFSYQVVASDPDGDPLTYSLGSRPNKPDTMTIDQNGLLKYDWPQKLLSDYSPFGSFKFPYTTVTVTDGKGGHATQTLNMVLRCPAGQSWTRGGFGTGQCVASAVGGVQITSKPPVTGMNGGERYSYAVVASSASGDPLTLALSGQPGGMVMNGSGLIEWSPGAGTSGSFNFQVTATDGKGGRAVQAVSLTVCAPPQKWHADMGHCM